MAALETVLKHYSLEAFGILDSAIEASQYTPIDLSVDNPDLYGLQISDPLVCQAYIDRVCLKNKARVAYGGYLEKRNLFAGHPNFNSTGDVSRNIHLGVDFWAQAGTLVLAPLPGKVHSFKNNATVGDYGPTIILRHRLKGVEFYTLYGHLSVASLTGLYAGREFKIGEVIGTLGTTDINVHYAPHLHFQIIRNLGDYYGDYPGVCTTKELDYYTNNCPNPLFLWQG